MEIEPKHVDINKCAFVLCFDKKIASKHNVDWNLDHLVQVVKLSCFRRYCCQCKVVIAVKYCEVRRVKVKWGRQGMRLRIKKKKKKRLRMT